MQPIKNTDDLRIAAVKELISPETLLATYSINKNQAETVSQARRAASEILQGQDDRLLVIVGPCSIHDPKAALEYAQKLKTLADKHQKELYIIMRVYFQKPRTTVGWKGLINDPHLDSSFDINEGLNIARKLLLDINALGMPAGVEFLDTITPQYLADLVSWGAIGARTTESQVHRELASGLSMPIGFKNGTDGSIQVAVDAVKAARHSHHFLSVTKSGHSAIVSTHGNADCHIILRGGASGPNYDIKHVINAVKTLDVAKLTPKVMVDCSHDNSQKDYTRQALVIKSLCQQIMQGSKLISGVMIESHLNPGKQALIPGQPLKYGVSITDACVGFDETEKLLAELASAVEARRHLNQSHDALKNVRDKIDTIDKTLQELITSRAEVALEVSQIKHGLHQENNLYRPEREAQILRQVLERNHGPLDDDTLEALFRQIMDACLSVQAK